MSAPSSSGVPDFPFSAFVAMVQRALDAQRAGRDEIRQLWLEAAALLHRVDEASLGELIFALVAQGRAHDALALAGTAHALWPDSPRLLFCSGYALQMAGRHAEAIGPYRRMLACAPSWPSLKNNLAVALRLAGGDPDEEHALFEAASLDDPNDSQPWINLVVSRLRRKDLDGALRAAAHALSLAPDNLLALNNAASAFKEAQRWDEARQCLARACALAPEALSYRFNAALLDLLHGDLAAGWPGYEARWGGSTELRDAWPALPCPRWQGEPLAGKTLLLWGEQGMGDLLQFCRFVPALAGRVHREGGRLVWNSFPQMGALLSRSLGMHVDEYSVGGGVETLPAADYALPLMSIPLQLGSGAATLAGSVPYLHADAAAREAWRARLAAHDGNARPLRVGLVWTGSASHQRNPFRSVGLARYAAALRDMPGVVFHSLQPGAQDDVAAARADGFEMVDLTRELHTFDDTAALIGALDLVISVCTSTAHLSGALGQRTWVLLDVNPHWPWHLGCTDSRWYPDVTLYRQSRFAEWDPVLAALAHDLRALARSGAQTRV